MCQLVGCWVCSKFLGSCLAGSGKIDLVFFVVGAFIVMRLVC